MRQGMYAVPGYRMSKNKINGHAMGIIIVIIIIITAVMIEYYYY